MWRQEIKMALEILSLPRAWNLLVLHTTFYLSRIFKRPVVKAYPMAISVEPTTACNLQCPACPSGIREFTRPTGNMKDEVFEKIILSLKKYLLHINFYFQGEPLIHPKIFNWIKIASQNKIYTLISTNAHFLDKKNCEKIIHSGLNKIIISVDGMSQNVYEQYRINGNVNKVFEGINNLLQAKKTYQSAKPVIVLQWIVFEHNIHELPVFIEYCKKHRLYYQIKTAQVYSVEQLNKLVPKNEKYSRYVLNENELKIKNSLGNHCWRMWTSCVFTQDGMLVPCCFDKDAQHKLGDIKEKTFEEIWFSKQYNAFRRTILTNRKSIDICNNCSEGAQVWG